MTKRDVLEYISRHIEESRASLRKDMEVIGSHIYDVRGYSIWRLDMLLNARRMLEETLKDD